VEELLMKEEAKARIGAVTVDPDLRRVFEVAVEGAASLNVMVDELISEGVQGDSKSDQRIAMLLYHYLAAHCKAESEKLFKRLRDKATTEERSRNRPCLDMSSGREGSAAQIESLSQLEGLLARLSW
jgi:hemerythrin superfamily protein